MSNGCDTIVKINQSRLNSIASAGYTVYFIGRYLMNAPNGVDKALTAEEVSFICGANKKIVSIFQLSASAPPYFTITQATSDAQNAIARADLLGQPGGKPIFFAVDFFPATETQYAKVMNYFARLNQIFSTPELNPNGYLLGAYGCSTVCKRLKTTYPTIYTYLWGTTNCYDGTDFNAYNIRQHSQKTIGSGATAFKICTDTSSYISSIAWSI